MRIQGFNANSDGILAHADANRWNLAQRNHYGVPVTLTAIDANNKFIDIGSVTTNGYYGTFEYGLDSTCSRARTRSLLPSLETTPTAALEQQPPW